MFVRRPNARFRAALHEWCATALELVTLGEVRLAPRRLRSGAPEDTTRRAGGREEARGHSAGLAGRVLSLWPELDEALERTPEAEAADTLRAEPGAAAGLADRRRGSPVRGRRHGGRARSGRPPVRSSRRRQANRSSAQPSSPLSRTTRRSPSPDVATMCARSSRTPGRSSTRTSWRSS